MYFSLSEFCFRNSDFNYAEDEYTVNELVIDREYVTLGQVLKMTDTISSGGMAKWFLSENDSRRCGGSIRN